MEKFDSAPVVLFAGLLFGLVLLVSLVQFNTPTAAVVVGLSCLDSDGDTASVPGTVRLQTESGERVVGDLCESSSVLVEQTCFGAGVKPVRISCNCVTDVNGLGFCAS